MKYFLFLSFYLIAFSFASSQQFEIKVATLKAGKAYLSTISGEKVTQIDSIVSKGEGRLSFSISNKKLHPGLYRLSFDKTKYLDFVNDHEDVSMTTDANNILDSIRVEKSESNKLFYSFIKLNKQYKSKSDLLQLILARYPQDDDYYATTQIKLKQIQTEYLDFVNVASQKNPTSFIARYIKSLQLPVIDGSIPLEKQVSYFKAHSLDYTDFRDASLVNSDVFTNKSIEYLSYFRNPQLPKDLLEKEFMFAVDTILNKAKVNEAVYKHITEYLLDGFKKFGFDAILDYILGNYVIKDNICIDPKLETALHRRLDQAKYFKVGDKVPDIVMPDSSGKQISFKDIDAENILIIFYASWCPHCSTLIPQINELYKNQDGAGTEVFAISIDTSRADWLSFVNSKRLDWINVCDLKGWSGKSVSDYYLYATPTMFLIDKQRKIIAKPLNLGDLVKWF